MRSPVRPLRPILSTSMPMASSAGARGWALAPMRPLMVSGVAFKIDRNGPSAMRACHTDRGDLTLRVFDWTGAALSRSEGFAQPLPDLLIPIALTFQTRNRPGRSGYGDAGVTIGADNHLLMKAVIDLFEFAGADRTRGHVNLIRLALSLHDAPMLHGSARNLPRPCIEKNL
jgi:hypothetical protein